VRELADQKIVEITVGVENEAGDVELDLFVDWCADQPLAAHCTSTLSREVTGNQRRRLLGAGELSAACSYPRGS